MFGLYFEDKNKLVEFSALNEYTVLKATYKFTEQIDRNSGRTVGLSIAEYEQAAQIEAKIGQPRMCLSAEFLNDAETKRLTDAESAPRMSQQQPKRPLITATTEANNKRTLPSEPSKENQEDVSKKLPARTPQRRSIRRLTIAELPQNLNGYQTLRQTTVIELRATIIATSKGYQAQGFNMDCFDGTGIIRVNTHARAMHEFMNVVKDGQTIVISDMAAHKHRVSNATINTKGYDLLFDAAKSSITIENPNIPTDSFRDIMAIVPFITIQNITSSDHKLELQSRLTNGTTVCMYRLLFTCFIS